MRTIIVAATIAIITFVAGHSFAQQANDGSNDLKSYSVDVPETSEWQNLSDSNQLLFGRRLSSPLSTFTLSSKIYPTTPERVGSLTELLAHVTEEANKEAKTDGRYQIIKHSEKIAERTDFDCVEFQKKWVDHGGNGTNWQKMHMQAKGLICIHPAPPFHLFEVNYSIRDHSELLHEKAVAEGEHFLNSLRVETSAPQ